MGGVQLDPTTEVAAPVQITNKDEDKQVDIETVFGKNRLLVDSNISSVNVPLGKDPLPDTYFTVVAAGAIGDTIRLQIVGTSFDSTTPDADLPAVDFTYTLVAADVGNEQVLAKNFVDALNLDTTFKNALLEAEAIDDLRSIVHITSTQPSLNGENLERNVAGAVQTTTTGSTVAQLDSAYEVIVSRAKEVSLARDPRNPHRLGVQSISGTVRTIASKIDNVLKEKATDGGGSSELTVNGQGTPQVFTIEANPSGGPNKVIEALKIFGNDTNIKVQATKFLGLNSALTNGILIEITKEGVTTTLDNITNSLELLASFSTSPSDEDLINQSGGDMIYVVFDLVARNVQIELEAGTTDKISVTIRDNISSVASLVFQAEGFLED